MDITTVAVSGPVLNLAVEDDETYVAEGVIVHNCRSIFVFVTKDDMPVQWSTRREVNRAVQLVQKGFR